MASLPPRKNLTPTKMSRQQMTPLQILLQMGFNKQRAEKALAATGNRGVQLASDWLLAHINDPTLDEVQPREYILYACPIGSFQEQLKQFWNKSLTVCGWNGAHNFTPHITLVSFFKAPDECSNQLAQTLRQVMDKHNAKLSEPLKLETYTSPNFMGFFVAEEHADILKRIAMQYVKDVSNATIILEPHVKSLHLTLAYQFPEAQYVTLKTLVDDLVPEMPALWELRLYSRDVRLSGKQVYKVTHAYVPRAEDELELHIDDYIYISADSLTQANRNSDAGWVEGTSWLTGTTGFVPLNYIERTAESDAWTLHKQVQLCDFQLNNFNKSTLSLTSHTTVDKIDDDLSSIAYVDDTNTNEENLYENISIRDVVDSCSVPIQACVKESVVVVKGNSMPNINANNVAMNTEPKPVESPAKNHIDARARKLIIMRHGERVDFTFNNTWIAHCFNERDEYVRRDLNMPKTVPKRKSGALGYSKDCPLTNVGCLQARMTGEELTDAGITFDYAFCSPSLRCIQTCSCVLEGMGLKDKIKIRIEPGLFEWSKWYVEGMPDWITPDELNASGYNIDGTYEPLVATKDLDVRETFCGVYERNQKTVKQLLQTHGGNLLLVGHGMTLDSCSRRLVCDMVRDEADIGKLLKNTSYCGLVALQERDGKWEFIDPPCPPITISSNPTFNWRIVQS